MTNKYDSRIEHRTVSAVGDVVIAMSTRSFIAAGLVTLVYASTAISHSDICRDYGKLAIGMIGVTMSVYCVMFVMQAWVFWAIRQEGFSSAGPDGSVGGGKSMRAIPTTRGKGKGFFIYADGVGGSTDDTGAKKFAQK